MKRNKNLYKKPFSTVSRVLPGTLSSLGACLALAETGDLSRGFQLGRNTRQRPPAMGPDQRWDKAGPLGRASGDGGLPYTAHGPRQRSPEVPALPGKLQAAPPRLGDHRKCRHPAASRAPHLFALPQSQPLCGPEWEAPHFSLFCVFFRLRFLHVLMVSSMAGEVKLQHTW